jgi:hypothetical protein
VKHGRDVRKRSKERRSDRNGMNNIERSVKGVAKSKYSEIYSTCSDKTSDPDGVSIASFCTEIVK